MPRGRSVMKLPKVLPIVLLVAWTILAFGCSGSGTSVNPLTPGGKVGLTSSSANAGHAQTILWGYYDVSFDPQTKTVNFVPNRQAEFTCNVVNFLNQKTGGLKWKINKSVNGSDYIDIDIDISLTHPFPGMPQYDGYDVRGVFMGDGSSKLNYNNKLIYPVLGKDQFMLADPTDGFGEPDGYTRWYNKPEFSQGGIPLFQYTQGNASPSAFDGDATLNPYKYFADGLGVDDNLWDYLKNNVPLRGVFSAGTTNTRNYYLRFPNTKGVMFGYAVIASWKGKLPADHPANAPGSCGVQIRRHEHFMVRKSHAQGRRYQARPESLELGFPAFQRCNGRLQDFCRVDGLERGSSIYYRRNDPDRGRC